LKPDILAILTISFVSHGGGLLLLSGSDQTPRLATKSRVKITITERASEPEEPPPPHKALEKPKFKKQQVAAKKIPASKPVAGPAKTKESPKLASLQMTGPITNNKRTRSARIIPTSFKKPEYTRAAIRANYQDTIIADILVGKDGKVKDVKMEKNIPFGMNQRVINSIKQARFTPRKDHLGYKRESWTKLKLFIQIR
jgi:hypothetical protein